MGAEVTSQFWSVIGSNIILNRSDVEAAVGRIEQRMRSLEPSELIDFQDCLVSSLDALDLSSLASVPVRMPGGLIFEQTSDHFLYARCACLLAGSEKVGEVLLESDRFGDFVAPGLQYAEKLLYLARVEYQNKTGAQMR